jgi:PTS system mannitol-specific IIC component
VILSVLLAAATSFVICSVLLKLDRKRGGDLVEATAEMEAMKGKKSSVAGYLTPAQEAAEDELEAAGVAHEDVRHRPAVHRIVFACDAGMGSSAMGASVLRNKIKKAGFEDVTVENLAIANLTNDVDLIVTHRDLTPRAQSMAPSAQHVSVDNFMNSPQYDAIVEELKVTNPRGATSSS